MDLSKMTTQEIVLYGLLLNTGIGLILGLIPMIMGMVKGNRKFGLYGLASSIIGGALLGIYLAIPVAAIFTWLIVKKARENSGTAFQAGDNNPPSS